MTVMTDTQRIELIRAAIARIQVQRQTLYGLLDQVTQNLDESYDVEQAVVDQRERDRQTLAQIRSQLEGLRAEENRYQQTLEGLRAVIEVTEEVIPPPDDPEEDEIPLEDDDLDGDTELEEDLDPEEEDPDE